MKKTPHRISRLVDNYIQYRPRYPGAVLRLLQAECTLTSRHRIADIGSGTGFLSELFLKNGNPVTGIEPDPDMRRGGEYVLRDYPNFSSLPGAAEDIPLADRSVDFITVGQAFHWFDLERAKVEFVRILAPQGWVVLVWNIQRPSGTPFLDALQGFWEDERFWKRLSVRRSRQVQRARSLRLNPELVRVELLEPLFDPGAYQQATFDNPMICDFEGLKGRVLSNRSALDETDPGYEDMLAALEGIFQAHQVDGRVTIEHDTRVVYGRLT